MQACACILLWQPDLESHSQHSSLRSLQPRSCVSFCRFFPRNRKFVVVAAYRWQPGSTRVSKHFSPFQPLWQHRELRVELSAVRPEEQELSVTECVSSLRGLGTALKQAIRIVPLFGAVPLGCREQSCSCSRFYLAENKRKRLQGSGNSLSSSSSFSRF